MFLLYLDASGAPELTDTNTKHFVLLGVAVREGTWFALDRRLQNLKQKYAFPGEEFELHAKDFCCSIYGQDKIADFGSLNWEDRRKAVRRTQDAKLKATPSGSRSGLSRRFRQSASFDHLDRRERSQLLADALDVVGTHATGVRLFAEIISKVHPKIVDGSADPVSESLLQVLTRFDAYLRFRNKDLNPPDQDHGLLILDNDPDREEAVARLFRAYRGRHPWGQLEFVLESPFFVDSAGSNGVQAADLCAYAVRRYVDTGAVKGSPEETNFLRIFPQFDRGGSKLHGVRHYVPSGTCGCLICTERGHS